MYALLALAAVGFAVWGLLGPFHWWALDVRPWSMYALLLGAAALAVLQFRRSRAVLPRIAAAAAILAAGAFGAASAILTQYGADRPLGPALGSTFPATDLADAATGRTVTAGRPAGSARLQLVVCFRGFW